jgi:hypothetical protein
MESTILHVQIFDALEIQVFPKDLAASIKTRTNRGKILEVANNVLAKVQGSWRPRAVIRWLGVELVTDDRVTLKPLDGGEKECLHLGFASRFMTAAEYGLVGVFTAGDELERESVLASKEKRVMDAYLYDLIGLAVLEKTRQLINKVVEEKAREMNWGIGPFLSPGSVHGWELDDQDNLCGFVPMDRIGVSKGENGILKPFKTISCLIGIGPKFSAKTVGAPCDVCSKKDQCEMRVHE